ncbi:MAG: iron uptake porin [Cyanobium sp.]
MKPFQKLLLAPVAIGMVTPLAAGAAELNLAGVNQYASSSREQVTNVSQFSDVRPTDWAYQALSNLIERYGCVAGYPNGTFRGGQAMTRYEAAALLNACLDRISEVTDELKKLMAEFEKELAVLRGRVDGLEAKVGELEASQFSTTTKLQGDAAFVLGAAAFGGSQKRESRASGSGYVAPPGVTPPTANSAKYARTNRENWGALTFNYDVRLNLSTSFTGKDLLYTRLRAGNFADSAFSGNPYNQMALDRAYTANDTNTLKDVVAIDRLYYRFPVGSQFTAIIGPRARNTEFLAINPFFYNAGILDVFTLNGAPSTYNKATGSMAGLMWKQQVKKGQPYLAASASYVAPRADQGNPSTGGIMTDSSGGSFTTQVGFAGPQWALTAAWRYGQCDALLTRRGTQFARQTLPCDDTAVAAGVAADGASYSNNFALTAAWQPAQKGTLMPAVNLGWGISSITRPDYDVDQAYGSVRNITQTQSWTLALQWSDVFAKGNSAGMAVGQPTFVTGLDNDEFDTAKGPNDGNYAWEWWYRFQVTDNISVTPAIFYLSRPNGQYTQADKTNNVFGGLIQTQFRF